jgi:predicted phosphoribosyltransferase
MYFRNRDHAAELLVQELERYKGQNPLILAIPRGAVPMGKIIAHALGGELDVVLVRKLGAPGQPELAIGAVDETGYVYLTDHARMVGASEDYIASEKEEQLKVLKKRRTQYTHVHPPIDPQDRIVIVVDDGIATGSTMIAALHALRARRPRKLIVATAVAPPSTIRRLEGAADEVVCLYSTEDFYAVGQFFEDFSAVSDEEVIELLKREPQKNPRHERSVVS